jgi:hypothetical protein
MAVGTSMPRLASMGILHMNVFVEDRLHTRAGM